MYFKNSPHPYIKACITENRLSLKNLLYENALIKYAHLPFIYKHRLCFAKFVDISGDVRNEKGLPLQNVAVAVAGTSLHAVTDENEEYSIDSVPDAGILNFSAAGFVFKAEKIDGRETVNVILYQAGTIASANTGTVILPVINVSAKSPKLVSTVNKILAWGPQLLQAATIVQNVQQKFREGKTKKAAEKKALAAAMPAATEKQNFKQEPAAEEVAMEKPY